MRTPQKVVHNPQFVHDFEGGRMDRVSTKITEKVGMLFQQHHVHAHTGQEEAQHHAGRAASRDTTARAHADIMENYPRTGNRKLITKE
jgi:hypothetical protein